VDGVVLRVPRDRSATATARLVPGPLALRGAAGTVLEARPGAIVVTADGAGTRAALLGGAIVVPAAEIALDDVQGSLRLGDGQGREIARLTASARQGTMATPLALDLALERAPPGLRVAGTLSHPRHGRIARLTGRIDAPRRGTAELAIGPLAFAPEALQPADQVGRVYAREIMQNAPAGTWFYGEAGALTRK